ncbi:MAG: SpoIIE family protein phosphatase, partial [Omnitrophica WOR_2 bacterium]
MSEKKPIRVAIVDDQAIVRSGLGAFLMAFDELQLVGEANDGEEAIQLCELVQPDVVLMDLKMPHMDGLTSTRQIRQRWPGIKVLVLTSFKDTEMIQNALEAGATGYLLKNISAHELAEAIIQVHEGRETVAEEASQTLVQTRRLEAFADQIRFSDMTQASLSELLQKFIPEIFPDCVCRVRIFPNLDLYSRQEGATDPHEALSWAWLEKNPQPYAFSPGTAYPWGGKQPPDSGLILAPIKAGRSGRTVGGLRVVHTKYVEDLSELLPMVETVAELISAALKGQTSQAEASDQQPINQELVSAARIQADILPDKPPVIKGWELTAKLDPVRETSGDFYDFIPLDGGKWGIVIADVTDKGMGAALFMALCSTLIRTYAAQYPTLPAFAISAVNRRILSDTRGGMFVTVFYGVLEPDKARLRYVNAGHNPPLLISSQKGKPIDRLSKTGMALGVMEDTSWQQKVIKFNPGDTLLLYTDGITEAQNRYGSFFGDQRILEVARLRMESGVQEIQNALLAKV